MAWTDVKAVYVSAGTSVPIISGRCRVRAFSIANAGAATLAQISIKNGSATTGLIVVDSMGPSSTFHKLPDAGVVFVSGVSVVTPTSVTMTIYYDGVT